VVASQRLAQYLQTEAHARCDALQNDYNLALEFINPPTGVHSFDNQIDDDRSPEIVKTAIQFMKWHLSSP
jgi:hypothetical protein